MAHTTCINIAANPYTEYGVKKQLVFATSDGRLNYIGEDVITDKNIVAIFKVKLKNV